MKVEVKEKDLFSVHCNMLMISALSSGVKGEGDSRKWLMCACAYAKGGRNKGSRTKKSTGLLTKWGRFSKKCACFCEGLRANFRSA